MEKKQVEIKKQKISNIKNIILVASGKGGVGKSTVSASLAISLAKLGNKVGLLDADLYGPSVPTMFNLKDKSPLIQQHNGKSYLIPFVREGVKLMSIGFLVDSKQAIIWRGPRASSGVAQLLADTLWGELDYLIIDTPPGTGDIHITLLQNYETQGVIVVTTPQHVALADVKKAISMYKDDKVGVPIIGLVENMAWFTPSAHPDEKYYLFGQGGGKLISEEFDIPLLAQIPVTEELANYCDEGKLNQIFSDGIITPHLYKLAELLELKLCIEKVKAK